MSLKASAYRVWNAALPFLPGPGPVARDSIGLVMVHDVHDDFAGKGALPTSTSVSLKSFETNVLGLARTFSFVSMDQAVDMLSGKAPWRPRCLVLTFDDSLKCLVDLVVMRLKHWGVPGTFYLSTDAIDRQQPYWWHRLEYVLAHSSSTDISLEILAGRTLRLNPSSKTFRELTGLLRLSTPAECERTLVAIESCVGVSLLEARGECRFAELMTWEDARCLARAGMTIGCHTRTHANLNKVGAADLAEELQGAREMITANVNAPCRHFCYPYGAYSERIRLAVKDAGFASAVTIRRPGWNAPGEDLFQLKRFHMHEEPYCLPCIMSGLGQVMTRIKDVWATRN